MVSEDGVRVFAEKVLACADVPAKQPSFHPRRREFDDIRHSQSDRPRFLESHLFSLSWNHELDLSKRNARGALHGDRDRDSSLAECWPESSTAAAIMAPLVWDNMSFLCATAFFLRRAACASASRST